VIRLASSADVQAVARLLAVCEPQGLFTERYLAHVFASTPAHAEAKRWAAVEDDRVVGYAVAEKAHWSSVEGEAVGHLCVHPDARGRGHGTALYARLADHLGAIGALRVCTSTEADLVSRGFAARRGFMPLGERRFSGLDPRTVTTPPAPPAGIEVVPLAEFADDPRPIWRLEVEAAADIPSDAATGVDALTFDEWRVETWDDPDLDLDLSMAAVVSGEVVAYTTVVADRPTRRMLTAMTGTLRSHRGQGLARLIKHHSLYRAAGTGIELALTQNHEANAPMLAVNDTFGYAPLEPRLEWEKRLP